MRTPEAETRRSCMREETEAGTGERDTMAGVSSRDVALACGVWLKGDVVEVLQKAVKVTGQGVGCCIGKGVDIT
jgi:hypothetical protein